MMISDAEDPFTIQGPDAMEMYDQLRQRRQEGMDMRLWAEVGLTAHPLPLSMFVNVPPAGS
jgi:hypothetical protein